MRAAFAQLRLIATFQLRRLPVIPLLAVPVLLLAVPWLMRLAFAGMATEELSGRLLIIISDLGCCLIAAAWAADSAGSSVSLDKYLRGYNRFSISRSLGYLSSGWLFLGVLAMSATAIVQLGSGQFTAELGLWAAMTLWLKLIVIYTFIAGLRFALSPRWRTAAAIAAVLAVNGLFYASPVLMSPDIPISLLSLLAMDYLAFTREILPLSSGSPIQALLVIAAPAIVVMALIHEITGFIGEISSR